jgi:septal ring factor EnvC (AmiA/AmiB activator)
LKDNESNTYLSNARVFQFYGFRKLRTDPILTSDVDPRTACYVRFYHDKFQKDRPELLHQIKRATKSDQQNKDEVESLKGEVSKLKECIGQMNHQIGTLTSEYEKVAALLTEFLTRSHQQQLQQQQGTQQQAPAAAPQAVAAARGAYNAPDLMHSLSQVAAASLQSHLQASGPTNGALKRDNPEPAPELSSSRQRTG